MTDPLPTCVNRKRTWAKPSGGVTYCALHSKPDNSAPRFIRTPYSPVTLVVVSSPEPSAFAPRPPSAWANGESWLWTAIAAALCTALFGTVYWSTPYSDLDIGSIGLWLYLVAMVPVIVLRATRTAPFLMAAAALPTGLVLAVMARIAVDVGRDGTSHNLWPIEIVIAGVVGVFWGVIAAAIGEAALRLRSR